MLLKFGAKVYLTGFMLFTLLVCLFYFYKGTPRASLQEKDDKKFVRKLPNPGSPVELTKLKLKGKPIDFNRGVDGDNEWVKNLSIDAKNISDKEIIYLRISLDFPADDSDQRFFVIWLEHGKYPDSNDSETVVQPIKPGETITLTVREGLVKGLENSLQREGQSRALKKNLANIYVDQVWFDKNTFWSRNTIFGRDPTTNKFNPIDKENLQSCYKQKEARFVRASFITSPSANSCYQTKYFTASHCNCTQQSFEEPKTPAIPEGDFAVWKNVSCEPPNNACSGAFWWVGTTPGLHTERALQTQRRLLR